MYRSLKFVKQLQSQPRDKFHIRASKNALFLRRRLISTANVMENINLRPEKIQPVFTLSSQLSKDISEIDMCGEFPDIKNRLIHLKDQTRKVVDIKSFFSTIASYEILEKSENFTEKNQNLANLLGWFTAMAKHALYIPRDVLDDNATRYNCKTWHVVTDHGFQAPNDTIILQNIILYLLQKYFKAHKNYLKLVHVFRDTFIMSFQGDTFERQLFKDIEKFDLQSLQIISKYTIAPAYYFLPLQCALYLTGCEDYDYLEAVNNVCQSMALLKKVEKDHLDSFEENPKNLNIKLGKCSWLVARSLEKVNDIQKLILKENYGSAENDSIKNITNLFRELNLTEDYEYFKKEQYTKIEEGIDKIKDNSMKKCLNLILSNSFQVK